MSRLPPKVAAFLLAAFALSCAGVLGARPWHGWRAICPTAMREVVVRGDRYCIAPLDHPADVVGLFRVGIFDDAVVFAVAPPAEQGVVGGVPRGVPASVPDAICLGLPQRCTCTSERCALLRRSTLNGPGRVPPRCRPDDPQCGPTAFRDGAAYRSGQPRIPLYVDADELRAERCGFDGECLKWEGSCESVHTIVPEDTSIGAPVKTDQRLADAFCGCVQGQCAWFTQ